jgi:PIN domain nuclease of toxin-antitoxin system
VRVVSDSHALLFYLLTPARLSERALDALQAAEDDEGIVVSTATLGGL